MWGNQANCYAYACNCKAPANGIYGAAVPGGYAKKGVFVRPGETVAVYTERLIQGVLLDAAKNSLRHAVVSTQIGVLPDAGSGYIIGMVANNAGFHFFRRDRVTRLWSWKDGIPADKSDTIYHIPMAKTKTVNDATFVDATKTAKQQYAPNWPGMDFVAYFGLGDIKGMTVAGIAAAGDVLP